MSELRPGMLPYVGKGRPKGSKNKNPKNQMNKELMERYLAENVPGEIHDILMSIARDTKARSSDRIKAAQAIQNKAIVSADVDTIVESKTTIDTPEEALAILQGLNTEV